MTREEAIDKVLDELQEDFLNVNLPLMEKMTLFAKAQNAVRYVADLPTVEPQEWISRQAVLNTLDSMDKALDEDRTVEAYKDLLKECFKELPPVEPHEEVVSRVQLVRELNAQIAVDTISRETAIDMLEHLPSVNVEPQEWIPVKDRLPEDMKTVLVSVEAKAEGYNDFVFIDFYDADEGEWNEFKYHTVVAWKPLPSPYKGDE